MTEKYSKEDQIDINLIKFLWSINPLIKSNKVTIPYLLRETVILRNLGEFELFQLSKYFHKRTYEKGEVIFKEGDFGIGFYIIVSGRVELYTERSGKKFHVTNLERRDYLGEIGLLEEGHKRSVSAVASEPLEMLGIFKPDLELMITEKPGLSSKFLQAMSELVVKKLHILAREIRKLKVENSDLNDEVNALNEEKEKNDQ
ncbi:MULTISPECIES: cyclic nucleotide-binding domain-containing protein [Halobacteriovorax]|uniref:Cyclic nucleotide-binding domain-containing protein n=1 Tax=Halobacteriovorax vibrionivorans TaxID=2152716 RepID=A0ABY0IJ36_9BACT|nr:MULTISPECIES: cyclic nucleotide-binding domain-containing protein [Halobacteriovorax]RZF22979.1 cyclic nucleotide-binding domain-containing protein [Halobacteriovorax vibrionivorans]TGD46878.1 cyclic nucleotide-binding domain-containing protein [Halobacteriovorax sp. Y22]